MYPNQPPEDQPGYVPAPPPPPMPSGYPPMGPMYPPAPGTNGFAVASLILGVLGACLLSIPFGLIALSQTKRRNQQGRGLAIAGLALSGLWLLFVVVMIVVAATHPDNATSHHSVNVQSLNVGECVNGLSDSSENSTVTSVSCADPHDAEVMYNVDLTDSTWPGDAAASKEAGDKCRATVANLIKGSSMADRLDQFYLYPNSRESWDSSRTVNCLVADKEHGKLVGKVNP